MARMSSRHDVSRVAYSYTPHCRNIDVAVSIAVQKHKNSRNTSHDSAMCMPAHGRSMAPHSHTHVMLSHTRSMALTHVMLVGPLHFHT